MRLIARCRGRCECGCDAKVPPGEVDHFFGRAKAEETEATCWVLSVRCHFEKTRNSPTSSEWFRRFIAHCQRQVARDGGDTYTAAAVRASARLDFVDTRRTLGSALGARR